jgi:hypothetical protein
MLSPVSLKERIKLAIFIPLFLVGVMFIAAIGGLMLWMMSHPGMEKRQAADILMTSLQRGDYPAAFQILETGPADLIVGGNQDKFKAWIETNNFQIRSWKWTDEKSGRIVKGRHVNSGDTLSGTVVFTDGTKGKVELSMEAFGMGRNPWRFENFELKRQPPST